MAWRYDVPPHDIDSRITVAAGVSDALGSGVCVDFIWFGWSDLGRRAGSALVKVAPIYSPPRKAVDGPRLGQERVAVPLRLLSIGVTV
jgi:hypothetical protein